jgi:hypothetical protein
MEIFEKVRRYLYENIGHMTTAGTPRYDLKKMYGKCLCSAKQKEG